MPQPSDFRAAAGYYVSRGWPVFPVHGILDGACTCGDPLCPEKNRGKHPATDHGHLEASLTAELDRLFPDFITRNLAIATGVNARLAVIDIDPRNGGMEAWEEFEDMFPDATFATHTVATGGGGLHLYYDTGSDACPTIPNFLRGVDLKADGGYVLAPPSTHISGGSYRTITPVPQRLSFLPDPVLDVIRTGVRPAGLVRTPAGRVSAAGMTAERQREIMVDPSTLGPGERDMFFTFTARDLRRADRSFEDTVRLLGNVYERMQNPGDDSFTPEQLIAKVERAFRDIDPTPTRENREIAQNLLISSQRGTSIEDATQDETTVVESVPNDEDEQRDDGQDNEDGSEHTWIVPHEPDAETRRVVAMPDGGLLPDSIFERWDGMQPEGWLANDDGIAWLAQLQWGHLLRFDLDADDWLWYDQTPGIERWQEHSHAQATELMKLTVRTIERVLPLEEEDPLVQQQYMMFAMRSLNDGAIRAALRSLSTRDGIRIRHNELDNLHSALPVENGVIEPTFFGEEYEDVPFRDHSSDDLFTRHARLRYDSHAQAPFWESNLIKWFPDSEVRSFVQRLMGYAVFGNGNEKVFVVAHGKRDSGKSAFFNNVRDLLGDFAITLNAQSITRQRFPDQNHFDLAHIGGARLILSSETAKGASYDAELLKLLASGGEDAIRVRFLRENFVEVRNKGLLVIMTNHLPRNDELDEALWSRLMILPFQASFPADSPDTIKPEPFKRLLHQERDGVLRWFVEGYSNYHALGLQPPPASLEAAASAMQEEDWLAAYIDERCIVHPQEKSLVASVNLDYEEWCREVGEEPVKPRAFRSMMGERHRKARGGGGKWYFYGVSLKNPPAEAAQIPESWRT